VWDDRAGRRLYVEEAMTRTILVLNHYALPRSAAGGTRHVELFGRLRGWDAKIIASDWNHLTGERMHPDGIYSTVRTTPYSGNGPMRVLNWVSYAAMAFVRGLRGPRPAVVYASSPHMLTGLVGFCLARLRRARFVFEVRDMWPQVLADMGTLSEGSVPFRALQALERFLYRKADAAIALADGLREQMIEHGAPAARTHVVPNGPDPDDFVAPAPRDELRSRYGLNGTVIAYTGAHGPANGLDVVLDTAAELRAEHPDVTFLLVGGGAEKERLVRRATHDRLSNVRFMDPVSKQEMPALLGAVDAGLLVFADKPIFARHMSANKLYDYMAAGLPVISAVPGEGARYIERVGAGITVGPRELTAAVRKMLATTPDERRRLGHAGRCYITEHQSRSAMAAKLELILDRVSQSSMDEAHR
jgi:glycosyltransferase involved in cell wall biosynthesis